ncbi:hypothetical protein DFH07DRAFT_943287 [Mycena maculata]|uniref:Secreted protein n=1 Tax=Mycena maculata TaxID=230809 RepID=A0AAD7IGP7_9AGAR|nr:hypothetical protein DFH07DRAFT_943287 [Mycena maculata]
MTAVGSSALPLWLRSTLLFVLGVPGFSPFLAAQVAARRCPETPISFVFCINTPPRPPASGVFYYVLSNEVLFRPLLGACSLLRKSEYLYLRTDRIRDTRPEAEIESCYLPYVAVSVKATYRLQGMNHRIRSRAEPELEEKWSSKGTKFVAHARELVCVLGSQVRRESFLDSEETQRGPAVFELGRVVQGRLGKRENDGRVLPARHRMKAVGHLDGHKNQLGGPKSGLAVHETVMKLKTVDEPGRPESPETTGRQGGPVDAMEHRAEPTKLFPYATRTPSLVWRGRSGSC